MELVQRITPRLQIGIMRQRMDDLIAGMMYVMGTASAAKAQALVHWLAAVRIVRMAGSCGTNSYVVEACAEHACAIG